MRVDADGCMFLTMYGLGVCKCVAHNGDSTEAGGGERVRAWRGQPQNAEVASVLFSINDCTTIAVSITTMLLLLFVSL